ncbi:hypothetical protein D3C87_2086980 [compost metagenome]
MKLKSRMLRDCSQTWRISMVDAPKAPETDDIAGTMMVVAPICRAKPQAWAAPAPPHAKTTNLRGLWPFSATSLNIS